MRTIRLSAFILVSCCALALIACGSDKKTLSPTSTAPAASATATSASTPTGTGTPAATEGPFQGARNPVVVPGPTAPPVVVLSDVRSAAHAGYDRITFQFDGNIRPGYRVEYVPSPTQCGSGAPVSPGQQAKLQVHFTPAAAHNDQGRRRSA